MFSKILKGTFVLTLSGIISKLIGFYYRIFLSDVIGANGVGIYQMIMPILGLFAALGSAGVEVAMSKSIASAKSKKEVYTKYKTGIIYAIIASVFSSILLLLSIPLICRFFVSGATAKSLLYISIPVLPLMSIHSAIVGYYLGLKKSTIPGLCICIENISKLIFMIIFAKIVTRLNIEPTPVLAVISMLLSELVSSVYLIFYLKKEGFSKFKGYRFGLKKEFRDFFKLAMPISTTRILLSLIHSIEALIVPVFLVFYGLSEADAVSIFGIMVGMSMPFIMFPSAITNALSAMLLPSVSEAASNNNISLISKTASTALKYCMSMGIFFAFFFIVNGGDLGYLFFKNTLAGEYLRILAWLCPFIYVEMTLSSIINGFGLTKTTLIYNIITASLRIIFIIFFVPLYGIVGYLWGVLASEITGTLLNLIKANKICHLSYSLKDNLIKPLLTTILAICFSVSLRYLIDGINIFPNILTFILSAGLSIVVYIVLML
ncbi:MAG: oligosaccharide flippase family protein [Lachnospiraceae bacterium]|nr:oligosaccharide flippase family protein [Lachnospiraceae bacterium]MDE6699374.1 oligosaccharide flippase family protein [Lachnospiraceae bacterium]